MKTAQNGYVECKDCKETVKLKAGFNKHTHIHSAYPPFKKVRNNKQHDDNEDHIDAENRTEKPEKCIDII